MIQHTVVFRLNADNGSAEEAAFFNSARQLARIPGVIDFKVQKQINKKNSFDFGFTMFFKTVYDYQQYNDHPHHVDFVNNIWLKQVNEFLEIDYQEFN